MVLQVWSTLALESIIPGIFSRVNSIQQSYWKLYDITKLHGSNLNFNDLQDYSEGILTPRNLNPWFVQSIRCNKNMDDSLGWSQIIQMCLIDE